MSKVELENRQIRTLGPVADLEKHLPTDWWRTLFNSMYLKTDGDVIENNDNTVMEVDALINAVNLQPTDKVLDLCCGQGRHVIELYRRGYESVVGLDRSRYLIRVAKKRALQFDYRIRFSEGDARKIRLPESSLDCVVMFGNSFGYFESSEEDVAVLKSILNVLKGNGKLAMDIVNGGWMREHYEKRSWEWIDENHFVCRERSLSKDQARIISREVIVHAERGVIADQFYGERLYSFQEIKAILESLKFQDIQLHNEISPHSSRNQDLGMMANRMFISATAPAKAIKKIMPAQTKTILVLLGDPRLTDTVKRNGSFNEEDFVTINKLKDVLKMLPYKMTFLDQHGKYLDYLQKNKPNLVFNLCDEGYYNNATLELHVPALLDILGIPYSGADPACLAMCYNKSIVRAIAQSLDVPVPLETYYHSNDQAANLPSIFPALLKPNLGDSSIGITKDAVVNNPEALVAYLDELKESFPNVAILIQEFLSGEEYSVGIIGNPGNFTVLPILTVDYTKLPTSLPRILGYESKWIPDSDYWNKISYNKANLKLDISRELIDNSMTLFERLGCRDYARFDFRADDNGVIKLLEVNPNPGWCWDGKLNLMAEFAGYTYDELISMIINAAIERLALEGFGSVSESEGMSIIQ